MQHGFGDGDGDGEGEGEVAGEAAAAAPKTKDPLVAAAACYSLRTRRAASVLKQGH